MKAPKHHRAGHHILLEHPQPISLESLRVGLKGGRHIFTYVSGAQHTQGSFHMNHYHLGTEAPRVTSVGELVGETQIGLVKLQTE